MPNHRIMIVEDEEIVAADLRDSVQKMGYSVCAMASSGKDAIEQAGLTCPDLVLMDIVLKGAMDGIEAATQISKLYKIPVVYLTAFGETGTLNRAKIAEPYGYIIKPFRDRDLQIAIEISIYKKQAETKIAKMEHWLATVLKSIGDAVVALDVDGRITFMNPVAEKLTGWTHKEALGKELVEVLKLKGQVLGDLEKHLVEKVITEGLIINLIEDRLLIAKDGKEIPISDSTAPIKNENGESSGSVIIFRDISEHKNEEAALRESEEKYRSLAATADSMYLVDRECRFLLVNDRHLARFGLPAAEVIGRQHSDFCGAEEEDQFQRCILGVLETGESLQDEYRSTRDGRYFLRTLSPVRDEQGKTTAVTVVAKDITEHKRAEEEKQSLSQRLQRAEKMEALGILAGGVAHDLNNALGILVGYAELLYDGLEGDNPLRNDARNIMKGGEQAAAIVQDLLTLARRGAQTKTVININKIVTEYIKSDEFMRLASFHPHVRVKMELDEAPLKIAGSQVHLSKTLMNLVSNAAEAMTAGGEIIIRTLNRYVDRPIYGYDEIREGDYVVLTVSDEGEGITDEDMKRIFEPFYTKKVMGRSGTGLGLSVVWGTVKDHDGYIDVHSQQGKGTTFRLYFPATREEVEKETLTPPEAYRGKGEKILVVDDIPVQRDLASRILGKLNYEVETAASGEAAVAYLKTNEADLIVLDMIMEAGIDGFETYRQILEVRPQQKAIIVSGFAETERVKMTQALGAGAFVRKPYVMERIGLAVRKELDRP